jgi:hypothetical protein
MLHITSCCLVCLTSQQGLRLGTVKVKSKEHLRGNLRTSSLLLFIFFALPVFIIIHSTVRAPVTLLVVPYRDHSVVSSLLAVGLARGSAVKHFNNGDSLARGDTLLALEFVRIDQDGDAKVLNDGAVTECLVTGTTARETVVATAATRVTFNGTSIRDAKADIDELRRSVFVLRVEHVFRRLRNCPTHKDSFFWRTLAVFFVIRATMMMMLAWRQGTCYKVLIQIRAAQVDEFDSLAVWTPKDTATGWTATSATGWTTKAVGSCSLKGNKGE